MHDSAQQQQGQPVLRIDAKLTNADGEFLASGPCEVHFDRGEVTMWPSWEMHMLERQQGVLRLELDNGRTLAISERHLTFKLSGPAEQRITVYRLRLRERVPEHLSAGFREAATEEIVPAAAPNAAENATREGVSR